MFQLFREIKHYNVELYHVSPRSTLSALCGHTKPNSQRVKDKCRQIKLRLAILHSHSWQITGCFKEGHTEQGREPQRKSNALTEGGFYAEAGYVRKIGICVRVPKMHKADSKRDFSNCV